MKKIISIFLLLFNIAKLCAQVPDLEKAKRKYFQANVISYKTTAYYPNPETDATFVFSVLYTVYKPQNKDFEFFIRLDTCDVF